MSSRLRRRAVGEGVGGRAVAEGRLVVVEDYQRTPGAMDGLPRRRASAPRWPRPVHENGEIIGSLMTASRVPGRRYSRPSRTSCSRLPSTRASRSTTPRRVTRCPPGAARLADRAAQPRAVPDRLRPRHRARRAQRRASGVILSATSTASRPSTTRSATPAGDELLVEVARRLRRVPARRRHRRAPGRRRVRDPARGARGRRRRGARRRPRRCEALARARRASAGARSSSRGELGIAQSAAAAPASCCATPTSRCTAPRPTGRAATRSSSRAMQRPRCRAPRPRERAAAARSSATRSRSTTSRSSRSRRPRSRASRRSCAGGTRARPGPAGRASSRWPRRPAHRADRPPRAARRRAARPPRWRPSIPAAEPRSMSVNLSGRQLERPGHRRRRRRRAGRRRPAAVRARARDHRDGAHARHRGDDRAPGRAEGARRAAGDRRLRHRLLVAALPAPVPDRHPQDGQAVRRRAAAGTTRAARWRGAIVDLGATSASTSSPRASRPASRPTVLRELGCGSGQGYHFARPLPALESSALLAPAVARRSAAAAAAGLGEPVAS